MNQMQHSMFKSHAIPSSITHGTKTKPNRHITRCYKDRVEYDESNRVFYIYHLSRYHTKSYYHFGSTLDATTKELDLAKVYPYYKKMYEIPMECMHTSGQAAFEAHIQPYRTHCPLNTLPDIFCLEDHDEIHDILAKADELFKWQYY